MALLESLAAFQQTSTPQTPSANAPIEGYFIVGLIAVVAGFMVWVFIRSNSRRVPKE
jgi:hypothetical protein